LIEGSVALNLFFKCNVTKRYTLQRTGPTDALVPALAHGYDVENAFSSYINMAETMALAWMELAVPANFCPGGDRSVCTVRVIQ
jgi:hypothetical protein